MNPLNRKEHYGIDLAWYALDAAGCIGEFTTGFSPIPAVALRDADMLARLAEYMQSLPETTEARLSDHAAEATRCGKGDYTGFLPAARQGFYTYYEQHYGPHHECCSIPATPLTLTMIEKEFALYLEPITFKSLHFASSPHIDVAAYHACAS